MSLVFNQRSYSLLILFLVITVGISIYNLYLIHNQLKGSHLAAGEQLPDSTFSSGQGNFKVSFSPEPGFSEPPQEDWQVIIEKNPFGKRTEEVIETQVSERLEREVLTPKERETYRELARPNYSRVREEQGEIVSEPQPLPEKGEEEVPERSRFRLQAISEQGENSRALIEDLDRGETLILSPGMEIKGYLVREIGKNRVVLESPGGEGISLSLEEGEEDEKRVSERGD